MSLYERLLSYWLGQILPISYSFIIQWASYLRSRHFSIIDVLFWGKMICIYCEPWIVFLRDTSLFPGVITQNFLEFTLSAEVIEFSAMAQRTGKRALLAGYFYWEYLSLKIILVIFLYRSGKHKVISRSRESEGSFSYILGVIMLELRMFLVKSHSRIFNGVGSGNMMHYKSPNINSLDKKSFITHFFRRYLILMYLQIC